MEKDKNLNEKGFPNSRITTGLILVIIGILLFAYKMGAPIPGWIFTWPVILIVIGFFIGIKSKFQNPGAFIMILIGVVFLADRSIPGIDFRNYLFPALLIGFGLIFILRPKNHGCGSRRMKDHTGKMPFDSPDGPDNYVEATPPDTVYEADNGEYIHVQAVLGGIKRNVQSKNFKGGEVLSFMGGSEISFMQSDIQHPVTLEVNNVFGGTKLIIPSNWDVKNNISAVFGGVEDKRVFNNVIPDSNKKLFLKGSCVFGGVEVTNY